MIIVTCHKCGKEIHKADKCPYCGNSTKFGTVNGMTDIHENAYVEYSELATILDAGDFAKLIEKSRATVDANLLWSFLDAIVSKEWM